MTKWSIVASGQGANRIAFLYYSKLRTGEIGDRVLLLNTSTADLRPDKPFQEIFESSPRLRITYEKIKKRRMCIFGRTPSGSGNNFLLGEKEANNDFDNIRRYILDLELESNDVILGVTTLGGGTGNGSLPYIIHRMRHSPPPRVAKIKNFISLGILPYDFEGMQRHFNAICGVSRLIKYRGSQNSAMVILADNSQVERQLKHETDFNSMGRYGRINGEIIKAVKMLIAPGAKGSRATIDISDYYQLPSSLGVYHFTPCLSLGNDPEVFGLRSVIETASSNPMVPLDMKTATMAYFVVSAPEKLVERGRFSQELLEEVFGEWAKKNLAGKEGGILRYASLVSSPKAKSIDAMLLVGGFSLSRLLRKSLPHYYRFKRSLEGGDHFERIEKMEKDLQEYNRSVEEKRKNLGKRVKTTLK